MVIEGPTNICVKTLPLDHLKNTVYCVRDGNERRSVYLVPVTRTATSAFFGYICFDYETDELVSFSTPRVEFDLVSNLVTGIITGSPVVTPTASTLSTHSSLTPVNTSTRLTTTSGLKPNRLNKRRRAAKKRALAIVSDTPSPICESPTPITLRDPLIRTYLSVVKTGLPVAPLDSPSHFLPQSKKKVTRRGAAPKSEPVSSQVQQLTTEAKTTVVTLNVLDDAVFPYTTFGGVRLPREVLDITRAQVPKILASFQEYTPLSFKTPELAKVHRELKRQLGAFPRFDGEYEDIRLIQQFLVLLYSQAPLRPYIKPEVEPVPGHVDHSDNKFRIADIPGEYYTPKDEGTAQFTVVCDTGPLADVVLRPTPRSHMLTPLKIKSIIKTAKENGKDFKFISSTLKSKMPVLGKVEDIYGNDTPKKWWLPFIPHLWLRTVPLDSKRFYTLIKNYINDLRVTILHSANVYYDVSLLSGKDRMELMEQRSKAVAEIMRSPSVQLQYAHGVSHEQVATDILLNHASDLNKVTVQDKVIQSAVTKVGQKKHAVRSKERDAKRVLCLGEFATQSHGLSRFLPRNMAPTLLATVGLVAFLGVTRFVSSRMRIPQRLTALSTTFSKTVDSVNRVNDFVAMADEWNKGFVSSGTAYPDKAKVIAMDIKTLVHILYHAYLGETQAALEWASNFVVTRPELLAKAITSLAGAWSRTKAEEMCTVVTPKGERRTTDAKGYKRLVDAYNSGATPKEMEALYAEFTQDYVIVQSGENTVSALASVFTAFGSLLPKLSDEDVRKANNQFTYMNHVRRYASDGLNLLLKVISMVSRTFYGCDVLDETYQAHVSAMLSVIQFSNSLMLSRDLASDRSALTQVMAAYEEAKRTAMHPLMQSVPSFYVNYFQTRYKALEAKAIECQNFLTNAHNRDEPTMVFFTGKPGVGKTGATKYIMEALSYFADVPHTESLVYSFNPISPFWDGYAKQPYVVMDDIYKIAQKEARILESAAVISMINTSVVSLNMSAVGDKGNNFFDSQFVFASTNLANDGIRNADFTSVGLSDCNAVLRRLHIVLHRDTPLVDGEDIATSMWRVDQCKLAPAYVNSTISLRTVVLLIRAVRQKQQQLARSYAVSPAKMALSFERYKATNTQLDLSAVAIDDAALARVMDEASESEHSDLSSEQSDLSLDPNGDFMPESFGSAAQAALDMYERLANVAKEDLVPPFVVKIFNDPHEFFTTCLAQQVFGFTPEVAAYAVPVFYMLSALAAGGVLFYTLCGRDLAPDEPEMSYQSQPQRFYVKQGVVKVRGAVGSNGFQSLRSKNEKLGNRGFRKAKAKARLYKHNPTGNGFQIQSGESDYYRSLLITVSRCVVEVTGRTSGPMVLSDCCIASHLKDGKFLVPAHFFLQFLEEAGAELTITWLGREFTFPFPQDYIQMEGEDAVIFSAPRKNFDLPPPLYPYFQEASVEYLLVNEGCPMTLLMTDGNTPSYRKVHRAIGVPDVRYTHDNEVYVTVNPYTYHEQTFGGDSGAVLSVQGSNGGPVVVGMHIGRKSGSMGCGISLPLCREDLDNLLSEFVTQSAQGATRVEGFPFDVEYVVPPERGIREAGNSKLTPTSLIGWAGKPTRVPARQRPFRNDAGDIVVPMLVALSKLKQVYSPPTEIPPGVVDYLHRNFPIPTDFTPGPTSYEEALRGDFKKGSLGIVYSTSSGYPFSLDKGSSKGKGPYIVKVMDERGFERLEYAPEFLDQVKSLDQRIRAGTHVDAIWADVLKDELRPIAKQQAGKTRLIATCPLDFLILYRKYFLDFITAAHRIAASSPVAVGINPHSVDWTHLHTRLNVNGNSIISGDYANYDGKLPKFVGEVFLKFVNEWYDDGEEAARARVVLVTNVFNAVRLNGVNVYRVADGNPSGNPITSIYNSICNVIMLYVVFVVDLRLEPNSFQMSTYGDDNLSSVPLPGLRCSDVAVHIARRFNMKYTHFSKDESDQVDNMSTVRYLGRAFVVGETFVRAPLDLTIIREITYYFGSQSDRNATMISMATSYFLEVHHFGSQFYREESQRFLKTILESVQYGEIYGQVVGVRKTYNELFRQMYVDGGINYYARTLPPSPTIPVVEDCN